MVKTIKLSKKHILISTLCVIISVLFNFDTLHAENYKIRTVVIDAGHGGHDPGAKGPTGAQEKMVTLQVALKLGEKLKRAYPDIKVIYTRKTDVFIPLYERASIANKNHADLFISIHCNSATNRAAYGTETFVMGTHKTNDQLDVAKRENSVIELEDNTEDMYDGFDPNAPETMIMMSINLSAYLEQSMLFASKVQNEYTDKIKRSNRGVKQAGFAVLYRTTMPSVLTEIGFISNPTEEKYITSAQGQDDISTAILDAFTNYKKVMESGPSGIVHSATVPDAPISNPIPEQKPVANETVKKEEVPESTKIEKSSKNDEKGIIYKIQIAVTSKKINTNQHPYNSIKNLSFETVNNMYKYLAGNLNSFSVAQGELQNIKRLGFSDAFIVVYKNGKRLNTSEAKDYLQ